MAFRTSSIRGLVQISKQQSLVQYCSSPAKKFHSICWSCLVNQSARAKQAQAPAPAPRRRRRWSSFDGYRSFSLTSNLAKKSSGSAKSNRKSPSIEPSDHTRHIPNNKHTRSIDNEPDPYDQSELQRAIDEAIGRLKEALTRSKDAGRVSIEMIEGLPVALNVKGSSKSGRDEPSHKEHTKLRDIASVAPKGGRMLQVFCAEESHIKPLITSIQSSPYSLAPQANDPHNPLLILVPIPPATQETRNAAVKEAKRVMEKASLDVKNARAEAQKKFNKMKTQGIVVPDELRKAHTQMEAVAKAGQEEVKKVHDAAVRALQNF